jgi:hypothetical protein
MGPNAPRMAWPSGVRRRPKKCRAANPYVRNGRYSAAATGTPTGDGLPDAARDAAAATVARVPLLRRWRGPATPLVAQGRRPWKSCASTTHRARSCLRRSTPAGRRSHGGGSSGCRSGQLARSWSSDTARAGFGPKQRLDALPDFGSTIAGSSPSKTSALYRTLPAYETSVSRWCRDVFVKSEPPRVSVPPTVTTMCGQTATTISVFVWRVLCIAGIRREMPAKRARVQSPSPSGVGPLHGGSAK